MECFRSISRRLSAFNDVDAYLVGVELRSLLMLHPYRGGQIRLQHLSGGYINGFHRELAKMEPVYPELNGISRTPVSSNCLSFANGEIKGTKKEIASYSHSNACLIYLAISDRKGFSEGTVSQREMVNDQLQVSETWTLLVNPKGERAGAFRDAVDKAKERYVTHMYKALKEMDTVQQRASPLPRPPQTGHSESGH